MSVLAPGRAKLADVDRAPLLATLVFVVLAAACGRGPEQACGPVVRESLDPQSGLHILDAADVSYLTDPPTSGPHVSGALPSGSVDEPLPYPLQVAVLEDGGVMIQYGELDPGDVETLEGLAADGVVVAPLADAGEPVVATAWLHKQSCSAVDGDTLRAFVDDHLDPTRGHE